MNNIIYTNNNNRNTRINNNNSNNNNNMFNFGGSNISINFNGGKTKELYKNKILIIEGKILNEK